MHQDNVATSLRLYEKSIKLIIVQHRCNQGVTGCMCTLPRARKKFGVIYRGTL